MSQRNAWALGLIAFATPLMAPAAHAGHTWNNYHWARTSNPVPLKVIDSVTSDWQFEFDTALDEWSNPTDGATDVFDLPIDSASDSNRTRKQCKMEAGKMRVCNADYGFNGWLGLASIGLDSNGHIDRGTAKVNDSYSSYWQDPNEKRHVMCQEIGHLFGLGHTSEDGSSQETCMDYSQDPSSISPNQHDYDLLAAMYAHLDSYNSYDDGFGGGGGGCNPRSPKCNPSAPDGVPAGAIAVHRGPFSEIWVMNRPDGGLWIFHVRLAPGGPGHSDR
jgi:hypothetical protein